MYRMGRISRSVEHIKWAALHTVTTTSFLSPAKLSPRNFFLVAKGNFYSSVSCRILLASTMADPYHRYGALADRGMSSFPGYFPSEAPSLASNHTNGLRDASSDFLRRESTSMQPSSYGLQNNISNVGILSEPGISGATGMGYPSPLKDPSSISHRRETAVNITASAIPDVINDRPTSLRNGDGPSGSRGDSNILYVDGLPTDCTRREVGHLFRPFIGYKDIKVIHKEPRRSGDKAMVFCFVEFVDSKCAITAMEALQGYKFDDKKSNSGILRIHFAQFPFRPPLDHDEQRAGIPR
ncbi:nuclear speckle RNA-binding protein A-like [Mercurialis annua]|uniref:nuclear speckle RNA-binding protein A-like n=1 Tax=Mercurialis annua TaxID=3986 RepID=UPI00215F1FF4|nr:nuclear speckle RNA-binding protein A-like [Mercurialis annua]